jgi:hypothetical protein
MKEMTRERSRSNVKDMIKTAKIKSKKEIKLKIMKKKEKKKKDDVEK